MYNLLSATDAATFADALGFAAPAPETDPAPYAPVRLGQGPTETQQAIIDSILDGGRSEFFDMPLDIDEDLGDAPLVTETVDEVTETDPTPTPPATPPAPVTATPPCFWAATPSTFAPRKGFETVLYAALTDAMLSADEVVALLLGNGEFHRVAPAAATNRPMKPTNFLLKDWVARGILRRTA